MISLGFHALAHPLVNFRIAVSNFLLCKIEEINDQNAPRCTGQVPAVAVGPDISVKIGGVP
jgi:hypothetical protein